MSNLIINVFPTMNELVIRVRDDLANKPNEKDCNFILLFAYNGTGKTRLSMEFKEIGKQRRDLPEDVVSVNRKVTYKDHVNNEEKTVVFVGPEKTKTSKNDC